MQDGRIVRPYRLIPIISGAVSFDPIVKELHKQRPRATKPHIEPRPITAFVDPLMPFRT